MKLVAFIFCHGGIYVTGLKSHRCARLEVFIVHTKAPAGGDCGQEVMLQEVVKRMNNCSYQYHKKGNEALFIFNATLGDMCGKEGAN